MKTKKTLAAALRAARVSRGLSLRDIELLSEGAITDAYVGQIEMGKAKTPHPKKLKVLAKIYRLELLNLYKLAGYLEVSK